MVQFTTETPVRSVTIQGYDFKIPCPYAEGMTLTIAQAGVLNQTLAENVRNAWADRIKKLKETATDDSPLDQKAVQGQIEEFLEDYEFGVRRGRAPADPVEREKMVIARDIVKAALRKQDFKISEIPADEINRLAEEAIEKNPAIGKEAERRVKNRANISETELDLSTVSVKDADEPATEESFG